MGWIQYQLENYPKSLEYLHKAYRLNKDTEIAGHLSEVLSASGQKDEANRIVLLHHLVEATLPFGYNPTLLDND